MTQAIAQALTTIEQAVCRIEAKSRNASRGVRIALGFGMIAAAYGVIVVDALHGAGAGAFA
jgi:hypothetical protein